MPKISSYPVVEPTDDATVLGVQDGETVRFPLEDSAAEVRAIRGLIDDGGDPAGIVVPFTDEDGWLWGGFVAGGGLLTPGFEFRITDHAEFIALDADGWVVFDASAPSGSGAQQVPAWAKKRFLLFGDSITQTGNVDAGDFGLGFRANWPQYAYPRLQMADLKNYARSGASFREYGGQLTWQQISHQISTAVTNAETPDVIVVSAGTNDGTANLGSYETAMSKPTLADLDRALTVEAMRWAFWTIRQSWPEAMCFAALPLQRADAETADRQTLLDAIDQMAGRYDFIVIDAHHESGIVKDFEVWSAAGRDLSDGLHPNPSGQQKQANLYCRAIRNALNF